MNKLARRRRTETCQWCAQISVVDFSYDVENKKKSKKYVDVGEKKRQLLLKKSIFGLFCLSKNPRTNNPFEGRFMRKKK